MNLTKSQEKAVSRILNTYIEGQHKVISFKAPTGSGKTFMASHLISQIFNYEKSIGNNKTMIVIATISDAELPLSFAKKINEYKKHLLFNDFEVEHRESPSSSKNRLESVAPFNLKNNKVLIFGTSSFGKGKLFNELGILESFLKEAELYGWKIVYLRDEAHKGGSSASSTKEKDFSSFDDNLTKTSSFSLQMTATPKGIYPVIELKESDLIEGDQFLLKTKPIINPFNRDVNGVYEVLAESIDKFKFIKKEYETLETYIRPAMLIQIDSKRKDQTEEEHANAINNVIEYIDKKTNLNWLLYTSGVNGKRNNCKADLTLQEASKSNSIYDVIIFKVGASTGWDIPRACMLVQLRDVSSESLNIQTIGRIKRNPYFNLIRNEITDKYYIFSDSQERSRKLEGYYLKNQFKTIKMYSGNLKIKRENIEKEYIEKAKELILDKKHFLSWARENEKEKILEYYVQKMNGNNHIATIKNYIFSAFKLKVWATNFLNENKIIFPSEFIKWLKKYCDENLINFEIYLFSIKDETQNFKNYYKKAYESNEKEDNFKINSGQKLMDYYQIWKDNKSDNIVDVSDFNEYGYELVLDIGEKSKNIQYLDSFPEKEALSKIMDALDNLLYKSRTKFFAKMPTLGSNIYFEYFSKEDINVHKSFVDFALVTNDDRILMIEVKGHDDYDEEKTNSLIKAYSQYMKFDSNKKIFIAVIYAGKKDGEVKKPYAMCWNPIEKLFKSASIVDMLSNFFMIDNIQNLQ